MKLHENPDVYNEAVTFTARKMRLPEIYIEKDYWITTALKIVFSSPIAEDIVFKGGTALAKCFKFIERFSEDLDLVVLRNEGETNNQMKGKLKAISTAVGLSMPEVSIDKLTRKFGMSRKTAHAYSKSFSGEYGHVRDCIVLEHIWTELREAYEGSFKALVYGDFPHEREIISSLNRIRERLKQVNWNIEMDLSQDKK